MLQLSAQHLDFIAVLAQCVMHIRLAHRHLAAMGIAAIEQIGNGSAASSRQRRQAQQLLFYPFRLALRAKWMRQGRFGEQGATAGVVTPLPLAQEQPAQEERQEHGEWTEVRLDVIAESGMA